MPSSNTAIISLQQLEFGWPGQRSNLLDIERFRVMAGESVFIQGSSGSGKSTLLGLIAGVLTPRSGSIEVLGSPLEKMSGAARDRFRADHIGIVFQQFNLIPYLRVVENVTLPCHFSTARRQAAVARSGDPETEALRLLRHLDMADTETLRKPVVELSVGQQQRVAVARALIGAPEVLIADEPTSSLDADRRDAFIELLFQECREANTTLLYVSHDRGLRDAFDCNIELAQLNRGASQLREVS